MPEKVSVELEKATHRVWSIGVTYPTSQTSSYKFVEKTENEAGVPKKKMYFQKIVNGVVEDEIALGDSKIPPSIG